MSPRFHPVKSAVMGLSCSWEARTIFQSIVASLALTRLI